MRDKSEYENEGLGLRESHEKKVTVELGFKRITVTKVTVYFVSLDKVSKSCITRLLKQRGRI